MECRPTKSLKIHAEAHRVPEMRPEELRALRDDVAERGIRVAIEIILGTRTVIDGRSRLAVAAELGIKTVPVLEIELADRDPVIYMIRAASHRRHLTDDQRSALAEEERAYLAEQGKIQRQKHLIPGGPKSLQNKEPLVLVDAAKTSASIPANSRLEVSQAYNVSQHKVRNSAFVRSANPNLFQEVKAGDKPLAEAVREVQRDQRRTELRQKAKLAAAMTPNAASSFRLIHGDCLKEMPRLDAGTVRLIFADPPYNQGIDYGEGVAADRLSDADFALWSLEWMQQAARLLTSDGSLWVLISDEYADHYGMLLRKTGLQRRAWIKWYETFGVNQSNNFNRCSRHLFYCVKDPRKFVFNPEAVTRPSDRQTKYADPRANPDGKIWDNVWEIPRLVGTAAERIPDFPTQLPLALLQPIIGCASDPGDLVLDPFNGSGTTGAAAITSGRRYVGIDKSDTFVELATLRLKGLPDASR